MLYNQLIAVLVLALTGTGVRAADLNDARSLGVITELEKNGVNIDSLKTAPGEGDRGIGLGHERNGLRSNTTNDENLRLVGQLSEVEHVALYRGRFTAAGLGQLAALPRLKSLQVNAPSDVGPEVFAALPELKSLQELTFNDYPVTDEILGFAGAIPGLKTLQITKGQSVSPEALARFLASSDGLENLLLLGVDIDEDGVGNLGKMTNMKRLHIEARKRSSASWGKLAGLTRLSSLTLSGTSFNDDGMRALERMRDLERLDINRTLITDAGLKSIAGLTQLHELGLIGTKVTDEGMVHLGGMTELVNLYISETKVTARGLAMIPRKDRMVMMRTGSEPLTQKQFNELTTMFPTTQIFDPIGLWRPDRAPAAQNKN